MILKDYSKLIFFYPLLIYSVIALLIEHYGSEPNNQTLAIIWIFLLFINLVIIGFDFSTVKFFILFLILIVAVMVLVLLDNRGVINLFIILESLRQYFQFSLSTRFYGVITLILGILIIFAIIRAEFRYVKVEPNEINFKGLVSGKADRYPTSNARINMRITDVFEFLTMGAGSFTIHISNDVTLHLSTVLGYRKKKKCVDKILSMTLVEDK